MNAKPQHVISGTATIGLATFEALRRRGERVRLVNRSGTAPVPDDVEILGGDASDPAFATSASRSRRAPNMGRTEYDDLRPRDGGCGRRRARDRHGPGEHDEGHRLG